MRSPRCAGTARAAAPAAASAARRRHPADAVGFASRELEQLEREMREPGRHPLSLHDAEERAREIVGDLATGFRGAAAGRGVNRPIAKIGGGYLW